MLEEKRRRLYDRTGKRKAFLTGGLEKLSFYYLIRDKTMQKVPMTKKGAERLQKELNDLKNVERPAIIAAIAEARAHGDLSENAEYHAARERQSFIEGRIQMLESAVSCADVVDPSTVNSEEIVFGATVLLMDEETETEKKYQIVGQYEADLDRGLISLQSPLARALIGKTVGDSVEVRSPKGVRSYEILEVEYV